MAYELQVARAGGVLPLDLRRFLAGCDFYRPPGRQVGGLRMMDDTNPSRGRMFQAATALRAWRPDLRLSWQDYAWILTTTRMGHTKQQ